MINIISDMFYIDIDHVCIMIYIVIDLSLRPVVD